MGWEGVLHARKPLVRLLDLAPVEDELCAVPELEDKLTRLWVDVGDVALVPLRSWPWIRAQLFLVHDDHVESEKLIKTMAAELALADRVHVKPLARDAIAGA